MAAESDVTAIRDWIVKQPHLPQTLEDRLLTRFLLSCEGSLERTKATLELFFTIRAAIPEFFSNRDPRLPIVQLTFSLVDILPLEGMTPDGYTCFLFRLADTDPNKFNFVEIMKVFFMVGDTQIRKELDMVPGLVTIFDMTGWSLSHLLKAPPLLLKRCIQYCQDAQPVKVRQIHMINSHVFIDKLLSVVRPLISSESASLFHLHTTGSESLYQYVPKEILPEEYGGKAGTVMDIKESWKKKVEAEKDWFLKDEWTADESKRVFKKNGFNRPKMEGSFRSLSID